MSAIAVFVDESESLYPAFRGNSLRHHVLDPLIEVAEIKLSLCNNPCMLPHAAGADWI
jgi:hypothetical protein